MKYEHFYTTYMNIDKFGEYFFMKKYIVIVLEWTRFFKEDLKIVHFGDIGVLDTFSSHDAYNKGVP